MLTILCTETESESDNLRILSRPLCLFCHMDAGIVISVNKEKFDIFLVLSITSCHKLC